MQCVLKDDLNVMKLLKTITERGYPLVFALNLMMMWIMLVIIFSASAVLVLLLEKNLDVGRKCSRNHPLSY